MDWSSRQIGRDAKDTLTWVEQETIDIISVFVGKWGPDYAFIEVGPFSN